MNNDHKKSKKIKNNRFTLDATAHSTTRKINNNNSGKVKFTDVSNEFQQRQNPNNQQNHGHIKKSNLHQNNKNNNDQQPPKPQRVRNQQQSNNANHHENNEQHTNQNSNFRKRQTSNPNG